MRSTATIYIALMVAISPIPVTLQERGTTVVAVRTPDFVILAADSRVLQGSTNEMKGCKIERAGDVFFSRAGMFLDPSTGWDLSRDARRAAAPGGSLRDIADRFVSLTQRGLITTMARLKKVDPEFFGRHCEGKHDPEIVFAKIEAGVPALALRSFHIETKNGQVTVSPDPAVNCPGDCPTEYTDVTLGNHDAADKLYSATPHFWRVNGFVDGIDKLIMSESEANPMEVIPPISILRLDKTGAHWERGYQGLCPGMDP
jgi:hypothetical protein